jgi:hypothetical protein
MTKLFVILLLAGERYVIGDPGKFEGTLFLFLL